jgi:hypothetical protein
MDKMKSNFLFSMMFVTFPTLLKLRWTGFLEQFFFVIVCDTKEFILLNSLLNIFFRKLAIKKLPD